MRESEGNKRAKEQMGRVCEERNGKGRGGKKRKGEEQRGREKNWIEKLEEHQDKRR
jgi:hypothetical protein